MRFLTDFADLAVLLPLALCVGIGLAVLGWRRGSLAWAAAVAATLATMLGLKILLSGCATPDAGFSPSGHTAAATAMYGGLIALYLRPFVATRLALALGAVPVALLMGASRVALRLHDPAEVVAGAAIGVAGAALLLALAGPPPRGLRAWRLALPALALVALLHGHRLGVEAVIQQNAGWLPVWVCER